MEHRQSPCPNRCFDDLGGAFMMGACGGTVWHAIKGYRNAPQGHGLKNSYAQMLAKAPTLGGNFAVWGGLFSAFDCTITSYRQKEDPLNAITAGALTGGVLAARAGWKTAGINALIGGALLGLIEGLGFVAGRAFGQGQHTPQAPGMNHTAMGAGFGGGGALDINGRVGQAQPRRTLASRLDEGSNDEVAAELSLDDDVLDMSTAGVQKKQRARKMPAPVVYSSAVEFSQEDFTFNDADDFDE